MSESETENHKPVDSKQFDRVQVAIWRKENAQGNTKAPFFTVTVSTSYRDANGKWQRSNSFTARDLPHLQLAVEWAMHELLLKPE